MLVVPGPNVWRLVRTDRDAPSPEGVLDTLGPTMDFFLEPIQPSGDAGKLEEAITTETGEDDSPEGWEWRIGAARPIVVTSLGRTSVPLPKAKKVLGARKDPEVLPTVDADNPWFVNVLFFWRGQKAELEYPALSVNFLGVRSREPGPELDWYLDKAVQPAESPPDPGDQSWWEHQRGNIGEAAGEVADVGLDVLKYAVAGGVAVAVVWLITKTR